MNSPLSYNVRILTNTNDIEANSYLFDNLWLRSECCHPRVKAYPLSLWFQRFSTDVDFKIFIVENQHQFVAALPVLIKPIKKIFKSVHLATSSAVEGGKFLLDPRSDIIKVIDILVSSLLDTRAYFFCFDGVDLRETCWTSLLAGLKKAGLLVNLSAQHSVGIVDIEENWDAYENSLSKNHRRNRRKHYRLLQQEGNCRFVLHSDISSEDVRPLLLRGFEVEDRSWKGREGTSVLKTPGLFEYLCKEAEFFAKEGSLRLGYLELDDESIAFMYGWYGKGVHFTPKVGYDETYARFGPGQLLIMHFIKYLSDLPGPQILDFCGPLADWTNSWSTRHYPVVRIISTSDRFLSRALFKFNYQLLPFVNAIKGTPHP